MKIHRSSRGEGYFYVKSKGKEYGFPGPIDLTDAQVLERCEALAVEKCRSVVPYVLGYEPRRRFYFAGCREFGYRDAVAHWKLIAANELGTFDNPRIARAKQWLKVIAKHHGKLRKPGTRRQEQ